MATASALPEGEQDFYEVNDKLEKLQIYFETEMYEKASALLDEIIVQFPDESRFKYLRAIVDYQTGNYERASKVFVGFIEKFPEVAEPYYLLGEINQKLGKQDLAKQYFAKYCRLSPQDTAARQKLASISAGGLSRMLIMENGREDRQFVQGLGFYGACVHSYQEEMIKLIDRSPRTWSSMGIDFVYPLDLRGKQIVLKLKGRLGAEKFVLTFRDEFAKSYKPQLVLAPEEEVLCDWRQIKVNLGEQSSKIDLSSVVHMGLKFGFSAEQNPAHNILFVKDILIVDACD